MDIRTDTSSPSRSSSMTTVSPASPNALPLLEIKNKDIGTERVNLLNPLNLWGKKKTKINYKLSLLI